MNRKEEIYKPEIIGEKMDDILSEKKWTAKKLSEELKDRFNISFSERQINNYRSGNYEAEIGVEKIIAICKLCNKPINYLLNINDEKINNYDAIIKSELGLSIDTINKLKKYKESAKVKKTPLFEIKINPKSIESINELIIINFLINNTDFFTKMKEEIKNNINNYNIIIKNIEEVQNSFFYSEEEKKKKINQLKKEQRDNISKGQITMNKILNRYFEDFFTIQVNRLSKNKVKK